MPFWLSLRPGRATYGSAALVQAVMPGPYVPTMTGRCRDGRNAQFRPGPADVAWHHRQTGHHVSEQSRLAAVHSYGLLDAARSVVLDDLTRLAARVFDTPMSTVTLIDRDRQWFAGATGMAGN